MGDNGSDLLTEETTSGGAALEPAVYCVMVNWNGAADTLGCVQSVLAQEYGRLVTVVVDNGSTDDSVARIRAAFPAAVVLETGKNLGFAAGSNVGILWALEQGADYLWLLNNDTVAPADTCSKLVAQAKREPGAGIVGSVLYYMHDPAKVQAWGGGDLTLWSGRSSHFVAPTKLGPKSYLTFASALIPCEVFYKVGVLYEGYFMYSDDADFALRVTAAGYGLTVAEDTAVLHKEGGSYKRWSPLMDRYRVTAALHFMRRHAQWPVLSMGIFVATKAVGRLLQGHWRNSVATLAAVGDYWKQRGVVYRERV